MTNYETLWKMMKVGASQKTPLIAKEIMNLMDLCEMMEVCGGSVFGDMADLSKEINEKPRHK